MKARRETVLAGKALVCPSCKAPIAMEIPQPTAPARGLENEANHPVFKAPPLAPAPAPSEAAPPAAPAKTFRPAALPPTKQRSTPALQEEKAAPPDLSQPSRLPEVKPKSFESAKTVPREEKRIVTAGDHELSEEFKAKLKGIGLDRLRVRRRRRLEQDEVRLADWDTVLDHIPEAELAADEWAAPSSGILPEEVIASESREYVTRVDVDGKSMKRIKRIRKSRLVQGVQLFFRRMTVGVRWGILGLLAGVAGIGLYWLARIFYEKVRPSDPVPVGLLSEAEAATRVQVTQDAILESEKVVRAFYGAPNWKEKLKFVRRAEAVAPLMEKWYQTHSDAAMPVHEVEDARKGTAGKAFYVYLALRIGENHVQKFAAVEEIPQTDGTFRYLLDWETTEGYQPMELYDYKIKQPREPMSFRVRVNPYDYYNHGFSDNKVWQSYQLTYPGNDTFELIGYVKRDSALYDDLVKQLLLEANLILQVRYPAEAISRDQVEIEKIVHTSWYYERDAAKAPASPP